MITTLVVVIALLIAIIVKLQRPAKPPKSYQDFLRATPSGKLYIDPAWQKSEDFKRRIEKLKQSSIYKQIKKEL